MDKKIVFITGVSRGIGLEIAKCFLNDGYFVIGTSRSNFNLGEALDSDHCLHIPLDVTDRDQVKNCMEQIKTQEKIPNVLINNAGITKDQLFLRMKDEDWDRVIAVNQTGVFYCMKVALQQFLKQGYGNIVNIASLAGLKASPNNISYSASKFAVVGMTKSAAMEYATKNIRINAVCPGYTESALLDQLINAKPEMDAILKSVIPMKRYGKASEIADAIVWLASDQTKFMTGQTITLDGGTSL